MDTATEKLSPFSIRHRWEFRPGAPPEEVENAPIRDNEAAALEAIGRVGLIGSVQIGRLFGFGRHQIRRMIAEGKLTGHTLLKNRTEIPVFSLGPRGAKLLELPESDARRWTVERILQTLVFFQFCCAMKDKQKTFQIRSSPQPFAGRLEVAGEVRDVLVLRGGLPLEVLREVMYRQANPVITIAESFEDVRPYDEILGMADARLLLDEDLRGDYRFYRYRGGWVR